MLNLKNLSSNLVEQTEALSLKKANQEYLEKVNDYKIEKENIACYGDELMQWGISVSDFASGVLDSDRTGQGDYFSRVYYLKAE